MNRSVARPYSDFGTSFFSAAQDGRLVIARCTACGRVLGYTRRICACGAADFVWDSAMGLGIVSGWAVYRRAYADVFPVPWRVVHVVLQEGPRLCAIWTAETDARVGTQVQLAFDPERRLLAMPLTSSSN